MENIELRRMLEIAKEQKRHVHFVLQQVAESATPAPEK